MIGTGEVIGIDEVIEVDEVIGIGGGIVNELVEELIDDW